MILDSPTIAIKQDPEFHQQEQDDLILSYLNSDYVTNEMPTTDDPPSPPYSTSSNSTDAAPSSMDVDIDFTMDPAPSLYAQDPFLFHLQTALNEQGLSFSWPAAPFPTNPLTGGDTKEQPCLTALSPLFTPSNTDHHSYLSQPSIYQPQYLQQPADLDYSQQKQPDSIVSSPESSLDGEQSKKKHGGRKKREISIAPAPSKPFTRILPATSQQASPPLPSQPQPAAGTLEQQAAVQHHHVVKQETSVASSLDQPLSSSPPHKTSPDKSPAEAAYAKRQERLIKNRAAALLSRKRKREHLTTLEEERQQLANDNQALHSKVSSLEARVVSLEQENLELKRKLASSFPAHKQQQQQQQQHTSLAIPKHAKTTGMVFMVNHSEEEIILFSFALFSLPASHSSDQLTVGGVPTKHNVPHLIASSPSSVPEVRLDTIGGTEPLPDSNSDSSSSPLNTNMTTDLMLLDHVRPIDLQAWIKTKLGRSDDHETGLAQWYENGTPPSSQQLYLYADGFSRVTPLTGSDSGSTNDRTLSILCPLNQTSCDGDRPSYLQIDVQIIGSRVLLGELKQSEQYRQQQARYEGDDTMLNAIYTKLDPSRTDRRRRYWKKKTIDGAPRISRVV
ncbi:hypothetical protein [Absidia glauca]|uniref:BZIP domain-containing protein n=1 Tax=Absidia glauca TaxID=4829 RepID=A0A168MMS9_ABSGL|nr:hypothetical protein [Absidia glauca]